MKMRQLLLLWILFLPLILIGQEDRIGKKNYLAKSFYYILENKKIMKCDSIVFFLDRSEYRNHGIVKGLRYKKGKYQKLVIKDGCIKVRFRKRKISKENPNFRKIVQMDHEKMNWIKPDVPNPQPSRTESLFIAFYVPSESFFKSCNKVGSRNLVLFPTLEKEEFKKAYSWLSSIHPNPDFLIDKNDDSSIFHYSIEKMERQQF